MVPKPKLKNLKSGLKLARVWPGSSEEIINRGIGVVGIYAATRALEIAKSMKGDSNAVMAVAEKWRAAGQRVLDSRDPLHDAWASLQSEWEGRAYQAFQENMTYNSQVAADNANTLLSAENILLDLSGDVTNAYNEAVQITVDAAARIDPALGTTLWGSTPDKPKITSALLDYVDYIGSLENKLRSAISNQQIRLGKFTTELAKIRPPANYPENATDPKRWTYSG